MFLLFFDLGVCVSIILSHSPAKSLFSILYFGGAEVWRVRNIQMTRTPSLMLIDADAFFAEAQAEEQRYLYLGLRRF